VPLMFSIRMVCPWQVTVFIVRPQPSRRQPGRRSKSQRRRLSTEKQVYLQPLRKILTASVNPS
jgi:hypothetical protein